MIERYPNSVEVTMDLRDALHPRFQGLSEGISEFTFANIYLFRKDHSYRLSELADELLLITGKDGEDTFFMLPFGFPDEDTLKELFSQFGTMKTVSQSQAEVLSEQGYKLTEDRDNFDYLYRRSELVELPGNRFHGKRNLVNRFLKENECIAKPLLEEYKDDALDVLEDWRAHHRKAGDYVAAKEGLEKMEPLQLCGGIYYINERPVAYSLGEELAHGRWFVIHFEKAITADKYKGIYQFINQSFTSLLPEKYEMINREQDLGVLGLRKAKESYNPAGFVKKYKART